jgi:hypothetical protein
MAISALISSPLPLDLYLTVVKPRVCSAPRAAREVSLEFARVGIAFRANREVGHAHDPALQGASELRGHIKRGPLVRHVDIPFSWSRINFEVTPSGAVTVGPSAVIRIRPVAENRPAIQRRNESGAPIELASAFAAGTTGRRHHGAFGPTSMWRIDHLEPRSLGLVPGSAALLTDHAALVDRYARCRHRAHHRAHVDGSHADRHDDRGRHRRIIVVTIARCPASHQ